MLVKTPSASNTSADPDFEDAARFPCLTTGMPQPATTKAAAVEMFTVPKESPPVPQVSTASFEISSLTECSSITSTKEVISDGLSPFSFRPSNNCLISSFVALPSMTVFIAHKD